MKIPCHVCGGSGKVRHKKGGQRKYVLRTCTVCRGVGWKDEVIWSEVSRERHD